jgi:hypothetical protein
MKRVVSAVVFSALGFGLTIGFAVAESDVYKATEKEAAECGRLASAIRYAKADADPEKQVEAFQKAKQYIKALALMQEQLSSSDRAAALARKQECEEAIGPS